MSTRYLEVVTSRDCRKNGLGPAQEQSGGRLMGAKRQGRRGGNGPGAEQSVEEKRRTEGDDGHGQQSARIAEADKGCSGGGYGASLAERDDQKIQGGGTGLFGRGDVAHEQGEQAGLTHP